MYVNHHRLLSAEPLAAGDISLVLDTAHALHKAACAGSTQALLRGMNLGLICESGESQNAVLFRQSATALGARVSHVRPNLSPDMPQAICRQTAQMLGRLYNALECQDLAPAVVAQLAQEAGIPVYQGVACPSHPTARLAELLGPGVAPEDSRRFIVQAVLLRTIK